MDAQPDSSRKRIWAGVGAVAVIALVVGAVVLTRDDDQVDTAGTTTTLTDETTTTSTTPETTTTTTFAPTVDPSVPIFPDPGTSQRFDDPMAAVTAWATDVVGFVDPIVDPMEPGAGRSGEVAIRSFAEGAPTVALVRQLEDDTWYVIGATTDSIQLTDPIAGATITSPQPLVGGAYAFEGLVNVRLYADGTTDPIAETTVMGRGDGVLGDFSSTLDFTVPSGASYGVLILSEASAEDGAAVVAANAIRVAF